LGYYIKEILRKEELYRVFDDLRYKKNSLTYYRKMMDFDTAKTVIQKSNVFIKELQIILGKDN
jgi:hypothetical protein